MKIWALSVFMRFLLLFFSSLLFFCGSFATLDFYMDGKTYLTATSIIFLNSYLIFWWQYFFLTFRSSVKISDASPGVIIVAIGFMLPARPYFWCSKMNTKEVDKKTNMKVLDWNFTQKHFPWGVLLLLGFINYISPSKSMYSKLLLVTDYFA